MVLYICNTEIHQFIHSLKKTQSEGTFWKIDVHVTKESEMVLNFSCVIKKIHPKARPFRIKIFLISYLLKATSNLVFFQMIQQIPTNLVLGIWMPKKFVVSPMDQSERKWSIHQCFYSWTEIKVKVKKYPSINLLHFRSHLIDMGLLVCCV